VAVSRANRLLGFPDDARLLILNADDLGMCESVNDGVPLVHPRGPVGERVHAAG
jgi:hypothetical protein